ncbi:MAG: flagellar hook-length control protein FliK [Proteobacteria bacterium]|nr:flagellar hook-length control protein FliK [Pseudomonadota bacterium]
MQLRHAVAKGVDKISIQLSPASLGTVDVILEVTSGSRVAVQVIAERAETLDLLRADARGLERALGRRARAYMFHVKQWRSGLEPVPLESAGGARPGGVRRSAARLPL